MVGRGYLEQDFKETFKRYIPKSQVANLKTELAVRCQEKAEREKC